MARTVENGLILIFLLEHSVEQRILCRFFVVTAGPADPVSGLRFNDPQSDHSIGGWKHGEEPRKQIHRLPGVGSPAMPFLRSTWRRVLSVAERS